MLQRPPPSSGITFKTEETPIWVVRANLAAELAEKPKLVGKDYLLVIGKGLGEKDLDNFHPITHVETDEQVVENQ